MRKKFFRFSMCSVLFLCSLGWLPLLGLYLAAGVQLEDDEIEEHLPKGLSRIVYSYFEPSMAAEVATISYHQSKHQSINVAGFSAGGIYDPVMERIALAASKERDGLIVHEILHHIWFQNLVPLQDSFDADFQRLRDDPLFGAVAARAQWHWEQAHASGEVEALRVNELYCYLGEEMATQRHNDNDLTRGLPEYMARHYRGVLHEDMFFVHRQYMYEPRISWATINAEYRHAGLALRVVAPYGEIEALHQRGGVVGWNISRHYMSIKRIGQPRPADRYETSLFAGLRPMSVRLQVLAINAASLTFYRRQDGQFQCFGQATFVEAGALGWRWFTIDWDTLVAVREAYLKGEISVVPTAGPPDRATPPAHSH